MTQTIGGFPFVERHLAGGHNDYEITPEGMVIHYASARYTKPEGPYNVDAGIANEEAPHNEIIDEGVVYEVFSCDLPLLNEAAAQDAFNTMTAASVFMQRESGWVEQHRCLHERTPPEPCEVLDFAGEAVSSDGP